MTLRTKSLLIIGVTLVTLAAVVYALTGELVVVGVFVGCAFVLGAVALLLLEHHILRRTRRLSESVTSIGAVGNLAERVPVDGRDELATLAVSFNRTLQRLERSQGVLRYVTTHARCIIWAATVKRTEDGDLNWDLSVQDEAAAARVLPLDDEEEGYSRAWRASIHFDDRESCEATVREALNAARTFYSHEYRVLGREGKERWVWEEVAVDAKGPDHWRLVGVCTDITARKRAEQTMREARDAALEAARLKSAFLANVSHEVRTPLNGIMGLADLFLDTQLDDQQRDYAGMIKASAESLLSVMSDVIDYSRIEAGHFELQPLPFDVRHALGEVMGVAAVQAHGKGLELVLDIEPSTPQVVVGDERRLRQIVSNLVGNAIKFTERGQVVLAVAAESADDRLRLHLAVADTGIGIADDAVDVIFSPFQQADMGATRQFGGSGLGLAISRELARRMDGQLEVESEEGVGSTFRLAVTVDVDEEAVAEPETDHSLVDRRVLLVEDNQAARAATERLLVGRGVSVTSVATPGDAAAAGSEDAFDLVLCDADLGGISGFDLVGELTGSPVVMLIHADDRTRDAAAAREAGAVDYLTKPVRESDLLATLRKRGASPFAGKRGGASPAPTPPLRVLLAEDDPVNQQIARRLLDRHGHEVATVEDGRAAVERLRAEAAAGRPFDMVLMDLRMPRLDGLAATAEIRRDENAAVRGVVVVAMTAHVLTADREACLAAGMNGYLAKPLNPNELLYELRRIARNRGAGPAMS